MSITKDIDRLFFELYAPLYHEYDAISRESRYDIKLVLLTSYGAKINRYYNALNIADSITVDDLIG